MPNRKIHPTNYPKIRTPQKPMKTQFASDREFWIEFLRRVREWEPDQNFNSTETAPKSSTTTRETNRKKTSRKKVSSNDSQKSA